MAELDDESPFERWGIDPAQGPAAITERMRELAEDAPDEETRRAIRAAWEELTMHPARRFRAAVGAHPSSHGGVGAPPPPPPRVRAKAPVLDLSCLAMRPSIVRALGLEDAANREPLPDVRLDEDPILGT